VVRLDRLRLWLAEQKSQWPTYGNDGTRFLERPERIASRLRGCGLKICDKRFKVDDTKFQVVTNYELGDDPKWKDIAAFCLEPAAIWGEREADDEVM
jgi:hypothetical protein